MADPELCRKGKGFMKIEITKRREGEDKFELPGNGLPGFKALSGQPSGSAINY